MKIINAKEAGKDEIFRLLKKAPFDEVELSPRSISSNRIKVRVTVENALFFLEQFQRGVRPDYKDFTVDLSAMAGSGLFMVPMEKKNIPVADLIKQARSVWKK